MGISSNSRRKEFEDVRVVLPSEVLSILDELFPEGCRRKDTAQSNIHRKRYVVNLLRRAMLPKRKGCFSLNTKVLDRVKQFGSRSRKAVMNAVKKLEHFGFIELHRNHSAGHHCRQYRLTEKILCPVVVPASDRSLEHQEYQHDSKAPTCTNMRMEGRLGVGVGVHVPLVGGMGGLGGVGYPGLCSTEVHGDSQCCMESFNGVQGSDGLSGEWGSFLLPGSWVARWVDNFNKAYEQTYPELFRFRKQLEWSIEQFCLPPISLEDCIQIYRSANSKSDDAKLLRDAQSMHKLAVLFRENPLSYCIRKHGRVHYPFLGLKREIRRWTLCNGEPTIEIDLHATYWTILAFKLRSSRCKDQLVEAIAAGQFYESLSTGYSRPSTHQLKKEIQTQCLFGKVGRGFAVGAAWRALKKKYPELARFVSHLRKQHDASSLSNKLSRLEGKLFIDRILSRLVETGIPCLTIHDGIRVAVSDKDQALQICYEEATEYFGFRPCFKT